MAAARPCRVTDSAPGYEPGVVQVRILPGLQQRVPPGARQSSASSMGERAAHTRDTRGSIPSPSTVAVAQAARAPGREPGGCAFDSRRSPHARVAQFGSAASCKAVGLRATGGSSPSPGTHVPVAQQESATAPEAVGRPFESGRGYRDAHLAGAGGGPQNRRGPVRSRGASRGPWSNGKDGGPLNRKRASDSRRADPGCSRLWTNVNDAL